MFNFEIIPNLLECDINNIDDFSFEGINTFAVVPNGGVYDGDTVRCVFMFRDEPIKIKLRLYGLNTPEVRGSERPEGLISKQFVEDKVNTNENRIIYCKLLKNGKYGRTLANIYAVNKTDNGKYIICDDSINYQLLEQNLAKETNY